MKGYQMKTVWGRAATIGGLGALLLTVGCGSQATGVRAQELSAAQPGAPVIVSCEPNQRTLVRPAVVNGAAVSQVECVSAGQPIAEAQMAAPQAAPVSYYAPRAARTTYVPRDPALEDARVVPAASYPATVARPVRAQQVIYDDRPVRTKPVRSVKKSAVIIGSSAGVGAGVGAAVGGKKGALIGAVLGGGGATLWDQITRRK